jgi:hypothetical protein
MGWREELVAAKVTIAVVATLSGCAPSGEGGRYSGTLAGCGLAAATLVRTDSRFAFSPGDGALTIVGTVGTDGGFAGTLNTQPPDKAPFVLSVRGRIAAEQASVDYATPRCRASAMLARAHPPLL